MEEINLPIPFISQFDPQANEDAADACGPVSATMVLNFYGENTTVNQFFERTGAKAGQLITIDQMKQAIISYGYGVEYRIGCTIDDITSLLKQGIAPIVLVHYENLSSREDQKYRGPHFIVIDGMRSDTVFANDPDFFAQFRQDGDHHAYTMSDFLAAWSNCHLDGNDNNSLLIIHPKAQMATVQATVETATQPSLQDNYDHLQHLFLDLSDELGVNSQDDRQLMHDQMIEKIKNLKQIKISENDVIIQLNKKVGEQNEDIQTLIKENGSLETQLKSILANYQAHAEENTAGADLARKYKSQLDDKEKALEAGVQLVGEKKATFFHFLRGISNWKSQYEATILNLNKQIEKLQAQKPSPVPPTTETVQSTQPEPGYFDWFRW